MKIVFVTAKVNKDFIEQFKAATIKNAQLSRKEVGVLRFDVLQDENDPSIFALYEVYKDSNAIDDHKKTDHYVDWRDTVDTMMAEPRSRINFINISPEDYEWQ